MYVKVELHVEIDENLYPNLKKSEIRKLVKEDAESGHVNQLIIDSSKASLEDANYLKIND